MNVIKAWVGSRDQAIVGPRLSEVEKITPQHGRAVAERCTRDVSRVLHVDRRRATMVLSG